MLLCVKLELEREKNDNLHRNFSACGYITIVEGNIECYRDFVSINRKFCAFSKDLITNCVSYFPKVWSTVVNVPNYNGHWLVSLMD